MNNWRRRRSFTLIETIAALALLALLGVSTLQVQSAVLRQTRLTNLRNSVALAVEELLWSWRVAGERVTLPSDGAFSETLRWERRATPSRLAQGVIPSEVQLTVFSRKREQWIEVARWYWLVPDPQAERRQ